MARLAVDVAPGGERTPLGAYLVCELLDVRRMPEREIEHDP